ncbi:beta-ketoacyl-ACP synthase 3 [Candidatus Woesearchaeota archaeon]|jgi:3-oxoacyl-[acyl-carrier-protein] synthase III|nr:beta-ketoacyl-ACP synthase 3 [Candidatus Woesearchaeota archaeon]MBT6044966.1 beta-ketoacyl-ACP synthase 3 [Candidatus Woesearchaeota archaeon]
MLRPFNFGDVAFVSTGKYLPMKRVTNEVFDGKTLFPYDINGQRLNGEGVVCTDKWIRQRTGVVERRRAESFENVATMAARSIEDALYNGDLCVDRLNGVLVATVTSSPRYPSGACQTQKHLGINGNMVEFAAHDVGAACAGFGVAVINAAGRIATGAIDGLIAVSASELLTSEVDYTDQNSPLFGDGAGAVIIGKVGSTDGLEGRIVGSYEGSYVSDGKSDLIVSDPGGFLRMPEGNKVYKVAVGNMCMAVANLMDRVGWTNDDLDFVIPHQANIRIIEKVAKESGLGIDKVFVNIEKYGNMSSATCPVALDEAIEQGRVKEGSKGILVSFGSGLVTSAVALDYGK